MNLFRFGVAACALASNGVGVASQMLAAFESASASSQYSTDGFGISQHQFFVTRGFNFLDCFSRRRPCYFTRCFSYGCLSCALRSRSERQASSKLLVKQGSGYWCSAGGHAPGQVLLRYSRLSAMLAREIGNLVNSCASQGRFLDRLSQRKGAFTRHGSALL